MRMQGVGIMSRKKCHNEEELFTCEERDRLHPGNYFSFEEDGKLYWFDFRTIYLWSLENLKPTNPYTRACLTLETRKRLKQVAVIRERVGLPLFHNIERNLDSSKVFADRWMLIGQYMEENLFEEINPRILLNLNRSQFWLFSSYMRDSLLVWSKELPGTRRKYYYNLMLNCWKRQTIEFKSNTNVASYIGATLLKILKDSKQPYEICFQIMSARHRL
jgi:hypothetical protein